MVAGIGGVALGWLASAFRFQRRNQSRLRRAILDYVTGESSQLEVFDKDAFKSRQTRLLHQLYSQCHRGEASRVYALIEQLSDAHRTADMERLILRIGLDTNRYDHLTRILGKPSCQGGVERQVFGSLVGAGRWSEAVAYYDRALLRRKGSLSEWRTLRLCASVFGHVPAADVAFDSRETYFLKTLEAQGHNDGNLMLSVRDALDSGVCFVDELSFILTTGKIDTKLESSVKPLHHTDGRAARGDWLCAEYVQCRRQLKSADTALLMEGGHGRRVRSWLRSHRAYQCTHCGRFRRGFSLICGGCFCLDLGSPSQLAVDQSSGVALPIFGVDLIEAECIYWMSLLQAT